MPEENTMDVERNCCDYGCTVIGLSEKPNDPLDSKNDTCVIHVKLNLDSTSAELFESDVKCENETCHINGDLSIVDEDGNKQLGICDNLASTDTMYHADCQNTDNQVGTLSKENEHLIVSSSDGVGSCEMKGTGEIHESFMKVNAFEDKVIVNGLHEVKDETFQTSSLCENSAVNSDEVIVKDLHEVKDETFQTSTFSENATVNSDEVKGLHDVKNETFQTSSLCENSAVNSDEVIVKDLHDVKNETFQTSTFSENATVNSDEVKGLHDVKDETFQTSSVSEHSTINSDEVDVKGLHEVKDEIFQTSSVSAHSLVNSDEVNVYGLHEIRDCLDETFQTSNFSNTSAVCSDALDCQASKISFQEVSEDHQPSELDLSSFQETSKITSNLLCSDKVEMSIASNVENQIVREESESVAPSADTNNLVEHDPDSVCDTSSQVKVNDLNKESDTCTAIQNTGDLGKIASSIISENAGHLGLCYETVCDKENNDDKKESSVTTSPKSLSKSQKLDQLLSKITHKAESDTQSFSCVPKQAKARKSFTQSSNVNRPSLPSLSFLSNKPVTCLTFNVKELEKQGVLDVPKPSKRKAFEPIKLTHYKGKQSNLSPVCTTVKSPSQSENPFLKEKLMKGKGKKKRIKRSGLYRLPGEKNFKKICKNRKKESAERQLKQEEQPERALPISHLRKGKVSESSQEHNKTAGHKMSENNVEMDAADAIDLTGSGIGKSVLGESNEKIGQFANVSSETLPLPRNALDIVTQNSRLSFASTSATKKAKKSVHHGIDPSTNLTLDSFLKTGSYSHQIAKQKKVQDSKNNCLSDSIELVASEQRKRKTKDALKAVLSAKNFGDSSGGSTEKKLKLEGSLSPPQMITLLPAGSVPLSMHSAIIPSTATGNQIIFTPCSTTGSPNIIQNGTLMPMFQILNSQTIVSPQTAQFLAFPQSSQSQGRSLLTNSLRTATLFQPKGMPLLLTSVHVPPLVPSTVSSQPQMIPSQTSVVASVQNSSFRSQSFPVSSLMPSPSPVLKQSNSVSLLKNSVAHHQMQLPNGQYINVKHGGNNNSNVPNGLYTVTPPKTPEDLRSGSGSHQDTGEELESVSERSAPHDKDGIPLCTCKISGASFQKMSSATMFCQALDSVDGKVLGCCTKVTNAQLVRPAIKIPFMAVCENHRKRLRLHQCCPGCGQFCTQGKFLQCTKDGSNFIHHFHELCQVSKDGKNLCPHCGELSTQYEIQLTMCNNSRSSVPKKIRPKKYQTKARIGLVDCHSGGSAEDVAVESVVSHVLGKSKKVLSTGGIPVGPDRYSLEKVLCSLTQERPKKYRHLPKCLFTPAYDKDLERVVYMLEDGHNPNEKYEDLEGQSALHAAAAIGCLAIVHVLVQAGASPHQQDLNLKTPLMFAAEMNHPDVVRYLIKANAILDAKAADGMTALHVAAKAGHVNIIRILLDTDRLEINVKDDGGWTPLIWATEHQEVEAVKFLLKRNADPNLRDSEENTTMHWAAFSGSVIIAELLLAAGCDLDSLNMHGDRPLHIAARQDHYECVVLFLARGADVEARNNKEETPLECCLDQNSAVYLALKVNKQLKSFGAKHMSKPEKLLHRDLSKGRENIPIPCVNGIDDSDGIPTDYLYVTDNIETLCLKINRVITSLQSCQCKDDCSSIYCACGKNSLRCWYDKCGKLAPDFNMQEPPLIFECNRACECWTTCNNRVVQNGVMSRLQVFKTDGRGWGCRTLVDIARGTFICEYIGEHISDSEADRREDDSYLFDLDNKDGETYCIDARRYGNVARFINHLCEPNLVPVKVFVDYQDLRFPRICLFSSRDISAQEELGFDYGEKFWIIKWKQFTCTCGSLKCRYSKDTIQKTLEEYRHRHEIDGEEIQE